MPATTLHLQMLTRTTSLGLWCLLSTDPRSLDLRSLSRRIYLRSLQVNQQWMGAPHNSWILRRRANFLIGCCTSHYRWSSAASQEHQDLGRMHTFARALGLQSASHIPWTPSKSGAWCDQAISSPMFPMLRSFQSHHPPSGSAQPEFRIRTNTKRILSSQKLHQNQFSFPRNWPRHSPLLLCHWPFPVLSPLSASLALLIRLSKLLKSKRHRLWLKLWLSFSCLKLNSKLIKFQMGNCSICGCDGGERRAARTAQ